jgi:lipid-A-disaccharide synthase
MKYYIIAGEASGDLHASNLMRELKQQDPEASFRAWGGDLMMEQGAEIVKHIRDISFMGFTEVAIHLRTILKNIAFCKKDIAAWTPDVVVMVDYPGFNLKIAGFVKSLNIPVFYYISPQIWAWKQSRVKKIRRLVDRMFVILPFEKDFYARFNVEVDFAGHPLLDAIRHFRAKEKENPLDKPGDARPVIALLPGSRRQEVSRMLKVMLSVVADFPQYRFVLAATSHLPQEFYDQQEGIEKVEVLVGKTYQILDHARAALVTSGTATLEAALFGVPEVVCYKGSAISFAIAKRIVHVNYISLPNLILDRPLLKELIQNDLNHDQLKKELDMILHDASYRTNMLNGMEELRKVLGGENASARIAALMVERLRNSLS